MTLAHIEERMKPVQHSNREFHRSILTEESRMMIQKTKAELLGSLPLELRSACQDTLRSGLEFLRTLTESISPKEISDYTLNTLGWGDGAVDIPTEAANLMREVILNAIAELSKDSEDR